MHARVHFAKCRQNFPTQHDTNPTEMVFNFNVISQFWRRIRACDFNHSSAFIIYVPTCKSLHLCRSWRVYVHVCRPLYDINGLLKRRLVQIGFRRLSELCRITYFIRMKSCIMLHALFMLAATFCGTACKMHQN